MRSDKSIVCNSFHLSRPWKATISSLSDSDCCIDIKYLSEAVTCPVCQSTAKIISRKVYAFDIPKIFFGVQTRITAFIPEVDSHNGKCNLSEKATIFTDIFALEVMLALINICHNNEPKRSVSGEAES